MKRDETEALTRVCHKAQHLESAVGELAARRLHRACPGAARNRQGKLWMCECSCHPPLLLSEEDFDGTYLTVQDPPAALPAPRARSNVAVRPPRGRCEHCGEPCRSRFVVGHDAKLKSELRRAAKANDPWAMAELHLRGWHRIDEPDSAIQRTALELAERDGWDFVERAVERRVNEGSPPHLPNEARS